MSTIYFRDCANIHRTPYLLSDLITVIIELSVGTLYGISVDVNVPIPTFINPYNLQ